MIKKIGIDIGHQLPCDRGANSLYGNEDKLNYEVGMKVIAKLASLGYEVINCTPSAAIDLNLSLAKRVLSANVNNVELFVSIHHNAAPSGVVATGTEVYTNPQGKDVAQRVVNSIASLGYSNRGIKSGSGLYVIRNCKAPAILVECCFIDNQKDMQMENAETMANAIVTGIIGSKYETITKINEVVDNMDIKLLQSVLNKLGIPDETGNALVVDGLEGKHTIAAKNKLKELLTYVMR